MLAFGVVTIDKFCLKRGDRVTQWCSVLAAPVGLLSAQQRNSLGCVEKLRCGRGLLVRKNGTPNATRAEKEEAKRGCTFQQRKKNPFTT